MKKLDHSFFERQTLQVSIELLGKHLVVMDRNGKRRSGKIVEVEAYIGPVDKACHAFGNKMTKRNQVMFGPGGFTYVYLIYGMYPCLNLVTEPQGKPCAVLIRAIEPVDGMEQMAADRYGKNLTELPGNMIYNLTNGPGKLCIAMDISVEDNATDLEGDKIFVEEHQSSMAKKISVSPRINIDYAGEAVQFPWRFYINGNPFVSKVPPAIRNQSQILTPGLFNEIVKYATDLSGNY